MSLCSARNSLFAILLTFAGFILVFHCSKSGQEGYIYQFSSSQTQPSGTTDILIRQRSDIVVTIAGADFGQDPLGNYYAPFSISGVFPDRSIIFEVKGQYYPTISFPFTSSQKAILGGMENALIVTLEYNVQHDPYNLIINKTGTGKIAVALNPLNITDDVCGQPAILDADILNKETGIILDGYSRYYFSKMTGLICASPATGCSDLIFFNVPAGSYNMRFKTGDAATTYTREVVVLDNHSIYTFGYQYPCQTFDGFKRPEGTLKSDQ